MSSNRRNFLRNITLGTGALVTGIPAWANENGQDEPNGPSENSPSFNMSGYAAPKLDKVRIGFVGLGMRGPGAVERMSFIEGVEIKALCDKYPDRVSSAQKILEKAGLPKAKEYTGEEGWKAMCESKDLDLIYITTPWDLHTPIAVFAMNNGKHAATEVPAALSIDECWQLVETSERTRKHCMMLENCCYDFFELLTLNMARNGLFGELLHAEGAYIHDLVDLNFSKKGYADMWRLKENIKHNGSLYPTHGLGPVAQCLNINRGDQLEHLVSMSTNDFTMQQRARELAASDDFFKPYADQKYRGNMNTTMIRSTKGKTIMIQHDVSSKRPYSRIHLISGTKGIAQKWPSPERIAFGHSWIKEEEFKALEAKYTPPIVKHIGEIAKGVGGHGGMDFIMDWRLIDCLRNGLPLDQDVYDAALWSSIVPLSEKSVGNRSRTVDIPDFTRGNWITNKPVNLTLDGGGTTTVRKKQGSKQL
ncbi:Gfo/Idh/MocA family protein [Flavihumibacter stibioxidans]|uniref:Acetylgalactosaminidase n=1 Tax=Flavihumibacter stibioxidans TaxID=1834163 RepID=A0ABR7MAS9_9BACT|nr:Gfo/Idh/MocA family oxidoreductase [Flavihumibacter stibioxidans]MBC6492148.1 acetylgalactosaminidase [Flavihumibacter stibioxidans]